MENHNFSWENYGKSPFLMGKLWKDPPLLMGKLWKDPPFLMGKLWKDPPLFSWVNQLFLSPFSIAKCLFTRGYSLDPLGHHAKMVYLLDVCKII